MDFTDRIELNPRVCNGKPVIKGTRIPVTVILDQIAEGESWDNLLAGYPGLKKEDIQAALRYAKSSLDHAEIRSAYRPILEAGCMQKTILPTLSVETSNSPLKSMSGKNAAP